MSLRKKLLNINACEEGMKWLADQTAEDAWATCQRSDWMLWIASRCGVDLQTITLTKVRCARLVQHLMTDQRSLDALDVAEQFALGNATRKQLAVAATDAANATVAADTYAATYAATDAAYSAAFHAAYAAELAANALAHFAATDQAAYAAATDAATHAATDPAYAAYATHAAYVAAYAAAKEKILAQCADICRTTLSLKVVLAGLATKQGPRIMNREQRRALASLTDEGYAVIVWTPEELGDVSARLVEDRCIELGHQIIDDLTECREP